jgi:tRNA dimethylallyltransferase
MGPTASGKSALAIELALRFSGEIINCDSVQVYREIEIATAKMPLDEQRGIPHHLLDFVSPATNYTAGDWARDARAAIADIDSRACLPLIVGGTGLYLRALRRPFFESPPTDMICACVSRAYASDTARRIFIACCSALTRKAPRACIGLIGRARRARSKSASKLVARSRPASHAG